MQDGASRVCAPDDRAQLGFERVVVVSHRLPVALDPAHPSGSLRRTVGGLVSGVEAFLRNTRGERACPSLWIGWAGTPDPAQRGSLTVGGEAMQSLVSVSLDRETHRRFYDGFSNGVMWPLCHSFPSYVQLDDADWDAYRRVNEAFCDRVLAERKPGDAVWVHDFQLMLLPALLRDRAPDLPVAYFHHVPFPPLDVLRVLPDPWAKALLAGILGADVVGCHTLDDVRKLIRASERLLDLEHDRGAFTIAGRSVEVDAFPIGIDFQRWSASGDQAEVQQELDLLVPLLEGKRVVLSVDRLDYTKGILNRLLAFEHLLEREPEWRHRLELVMVAVPSRAGVEAYRTMRRHIEEAVGRINGRFGTLSWTPVLYQYRSLDWPALAALYLRADVALVTPLRDGMNLIAKEYLAARRDEGGVLVLSDMAGAARELGEAVLVNPFHVDGIAGGLSQALQLTAGDRAHRSRHMRARLERYDSMRWGMEQFARLQSARSRTRALQARNLKAPDREQLLRAWCAADRRLVALDYDGTLVPFTVDPAAARPDAALLDLLAGLAAVKRTTVVILSGRDEATLGGWFERSPVALGAEHGARVRAPDGVWSREADLHPDLRRRILDVMQMFADRLPGSFVEPKLASLAWHWRAADVEVGAVRSRELVDAIRSLRGGIQVLLGNRVVEVRPVGANKGTAVRRWLANASCDFVLAAGDDTTDEDLFTALPANAWSFRIGPGKSSARFNLPKPSDLRQLLTDLLGAGGA